MRKITTEKELKKKKTTIPPSTGNNGLGMSKKDI